MSEKEKIVRLRTKFREVYTSLSGESRVTVAEVYDETQKLYPELFELEKERLFRDATNGWIRQIMSEEPTSQLSLPMALLGVDLPSRIPLLPQGKRSGPADWVRREDITYAELDTAVETFPEQPRINKLRAGLRRTRDYLKPHMADEHRNEPIMPVLAALATEEGATSEKVA